MNYTDQLGRSIDIPEVPKRIISVVPSQTELLADLGLNKEVVGITKFCVHPKPWIKGKKRIGGTKNLNLEAIAKLNPDLIIANKEENTESDIEFLSERFQVWISDVNDLDSALLMIDEVSRMTDTFDVGLPLINQIKIGFQKLSHTPIKNPNRKAAYLIWKEPFMTIGGDTFISDMVNRAGYENAFQNQSRYPSVDIDALRNLSLDYLFLSSEPFPFKKKDMIELEKELPDVKIALVDGEYFSWYGSRLKDAPSYFRNLKKGLS